VAAHTGHPPVGVGGGGVGVGAGGEPEGALHPSALQHTFPPVPQLSPEMEQVPPASEPLAQISASAGLNLEQEYLVTVGLVG
jgi:hypothetical protein